MPIKQRCYSFINQTNPNPELSFKGEVIKPAHACRYLGEQIDLKSNLWKSPELGFWAKWLMQFNLCIL